MTAPGCDGLPAAPTRHPAADRRAWRHRRRDMELRPEWRWSAAGPARRRWRPHLPFGRALAAFALFLKATGLHRIGRRNALAVRLTRLTLSFDDLPAAFDGCTLLHLTDLHIDALPGLDEAILAACADARPDVVVLTGDYRHTDEGDDFAAMLPPLRRVLAGLPAPEGLLAVLGNHDLAAMAEPLEAMGARLLVNETHSLRRGGETLHMTGLDDVRSFFTPAAHGALSAAPDGFRIALVHSPDAAEAAAAAGCRLYLCGHTHGGQVALPGGRPLLTHTEAGRRLANGLWRMGGMIGYTSAGCGVSGPPVRFFTRGEVTSITLRRTAT